MPLRFSNDQINAYLLYKQRLSPRSRGEDAMSVVRDVGPLRAAPPTLPYFSLWARMEGFVRQQLDSALYQERTLVRAPCMHAQLNIVPSDEFPAYYQTTRESISEEGIRSFVDALILEPASLGSSPRLRSAVLVHRVLEVMGTRGPSTVDELAEFLPILDVRVPYDPDHPELGDYRLGAHLLPAMCAQGYLVRAQVRGGWRSDHYSYAALSSWLPDLHLNALSPQAALRQVVLSYISAFGPVTIGDVSHWLGGIVRQRVAAAIMSLDHRLVRLEILGIPGDYFLLKEEIPALQGYTSEGRGICLLPPRDNFSMAYSDVTRFVDEDFRERIFDRVGESLGTVWADGQVVGLWWTRIKEGRIVIRFFEEMDAEALALVGEEARRLGEFLAFPSLHIEMAPYLLDEESTPLVPIGTEL